MSEPRQPAPQGGEGDCWAELLGHVGTGHPGHILGVERREFGLRKYHGQPVRRGDGRDEERDLREELLDAAVYAWRTKRRNLAVALLTQAADLDAAENAARLAGQVLAAMRVEVPADLVRTAELDALRAAVLAEIDGLRKRDLHHLQNQIDGLQRLERTRR